MLIIVLLHIHFLKMMDYCQICQCFALPTLFYKVFILCSILNSVLLFLGAIICLLIMNYLVAKIKDHGILLGALLNHK